MGQIFESRTELIGWGLAILIIVVMGVLVFTGPFHKINSLAAPSNLPVLKVKIVNDASSIGAYKPATVTARVGQQVDFSNLSSAPHTVTDAGTNGFDSQNISTNAGWAYFPKKPGTYRYGCSYHPLMHGTLVVTP